MIISAAVRNEYGELTGRCERLVVDDWIDLECDLSYRPFERGTVRIGERHFAAHGYGSFVGSIVYDAFDVSPQTAAVILNYIRSLNKRHAFPLEAATPLFDKWENGDEFTAADFEEQP